MKRRTIDTARKWLETAKSKDTFSINTIPHSKKEIEELLGMKNKDIEVKEDGDMGKEPDQGHTEESGD
jgi:hypothetical protein